MGMHTWTADMAAIRMDGALPTQEAWSAFIEKHSDALDQVCGIIIENYGSYENVEYIADYEDEDYGRYGIVALMTDVINIENPKWTISCESDDNGDYLIGIFAQCVYPWDQNRDFNAGMTPEILSDLLNRYIVELYGSPKKLDLNEMVTYFS